MGALRLLSEGQLSSSQVGLYLSTNGSLFYKQLTIGSPLLTFWNLEVNFPLLRYRTYLVGTVPFDQC
jgi:hypothetical protein